MREIKFRALHTDNKGKPIKWEYGTPEFGDMGQLYILYGVGGKQLCQRDTLGQFTGLHDKNGKEIYEGDLLRRSDRAIDEVFYRPDQGQFMVMQRSPDEIADDVLWHFVDDSEVIGNFYENPEPLKCATYHSRKTAGRSDCPGRFLSVT